MRRPRYRVHRSLPTTLRFVLPNRFVGTGVALAYLEAGYAVRGTTRSKSKAEDWIAMFPQHKANFEYAIVEDIVTPHCFDESVKGVDFIAHTASPFHYNVKVRCLLF